MISPILFQIFNFVCLEQMITKNMSIKDITGKNARALDVFSFSIRALIDHFLQQVDVPLAKIRWVLTVPASWSDIAKQFMAGSAMLVGRHSLSTAL